MVPTAGTPVRATANQSDPEAKFECHAFLVEAVPGNTGNVYIGDSEDMNKTTLDGVIAILGVPTDSLLPTFTASFQNAINPIHMNMIWVDVDVNGESALISTAIL